MNMTGVMDAMTIHRTRNGNARKPISLAAAVLTTFVFLAACAVGPAGDPAPARRTRNEDTAESRGTPMTYETILAGIDAGRRSAATAVVRSATQLTELRQRFDLPDEQLDPDRFDFDREAVVAAFLGRRNTGGYGIKVDGVQRTNRNIEVSLSESTPEPGDMVAQVLTFPFVVLRVEADPDDTVHVRTDFGSNDSHDL